MDWSKDITEIDKVKPGTYRSLNGAADENIFIGRASKAGFFCFFKVWRDMPYDAVIDYKGILYRIEIKGSSKGKFDVTRGTRSGKQIKKAPDVSRTRILDRDDCDFVVGVDSNTGDCYIVPEDVIMSIENISLSVKTLTAYKEKWKLLMPEINNLNAEETRDGLFKMGCAQLEQKAKEIGATIPDKAEALAVSGTRKKITDRKKKAVYAIWEYIANQV